MSDRSIILDYRIISPKIRNFSYSFGLVLTGGCWLQFTLSYKMISSNQFPLTSTDSVIFKSFAIDLQGKQTWGIARKTLEIFHTGLVTKESSFLHLYDKRRKVFIFTARQRMRYENKSLTTITCNVINIFFQSDFFCCKGFLIIRQKSIHKHYVLILPHV